MTNHDRVLVRTFDFTPRLKGVLYDTAAFQVFLLPDILNHAAFEWRGTSEQRSQCRHLLSMAGITEYIIEQGWLEVLALGAYELVHHKSIQLITRGTKNNNARANHLNIDYNRLISEEQLIEIMAQEHLTAGEKLSALASIVDHKIQLPPTQLSSLLATVWRLDEFPEDSLKLNTDISDYLMPHLSLVFHGHPVITSQENYKLRFNDAEAYIDFLRLHHFIEFAESHVTLAMYLETNKEFNNYTLNMKKISSALLLALSSNEFNMKELSLLEGSTSLIARVLLTHLLEVNTTIILNEVKERLQEGVILAVEEGNYEEHPYLKEAEFVLSTEEYCRLFLYFRANPTTQLKALSLMHIRSRLVCYLLFANLGPEFLEILFQTMLPPPPIEENNSDFNYSYYNLARFFNNLFPNNNECRKLLKLTSLSHQSVPLPWALALSEIVY